MSTETTAPPLDYRRLVTREMKVTRSSENAKPGDLILSGTRVLRVSAAQ